MIGMTAPRRRDSGITLVEVVCAMTVLSLGAMMSFSLTVSTMQLEVENRETAAATATARHLIEELSSGEFREVFASYNDDPTDDPQGEGTATGNAFQVAQRLKQNGLPDPGSVATSPTIPPTIGGASNAKRELRDKVLIMDVAIKFPVDADGKLSENPVDGVHGALDLDGNGTVEIGDRSEDYKVLPMEIELDWGDRQITVPFMLMDEQ